MKKLLLIVAVVVALLLVSGAVLTTGKQAQPFAAGSESEDWLARGPFEVHSHTEVFVDESRPLHGDPLFLFRGVGITIRMHDTLKLAVMLSQRLGINDV